MKREAIVTKVRRKKILSCAIFTMKDKSCNSKAIVERCKNKNSKDK